MPSGKKLAFGGCAGVSVALFILFLIFGIWAAADKGRMDPFFTPLKCTNFYLFIPLQPFLTATGDLNLPGAPVSAECQNPNQLSVTLGTKTAGDVLVAVGNGTIDIGDVSLGKETKFDIDSSGTKVTFTMAMLMPGAMLGGINAALMQQALAGAAVPAVPLFFSLDVESKGEGMVMFQKAEETKMLPKKYCGQLLTALPPNPNVTLLSFGVLTTVSVTVCCNTIEEALTKVMALDPTKGPTAEFDHSAGYVDNLDPTDSYIKEKEDAINSALSTFTAIFIILAIIFLVVAGVCVFLMLRKTQE